MLDRCLESCVWNKYGFSDGAPSQEVTGQDEGELSFLMNAWFVLAGGKHREHICAIWKTERR